MTATKNTVRNSVNKVAVIGAGQMGLGIAQVAALKGVSVRLMDLNEDVLDQALQGISKSCERLIKKEQITTEEKTAALSRIHPTTRLSDLHDCDFFIEAATEAQDLKVKIFSEMDRYAPAGAILCTNTSSISITRIAAATRRPQLVAGMHFMNPVPLMPLVEGIRGLQTSDSTFDSVKAFAEFLGKTFVESKDAPGFIVNRILMPMINEAVFSLHEGLATAEAIDSAMRLGTNQPMGPLALADFIGLDTCLAIMRVLHEGLGDSKYRPCPLLVKYVEAGWLGRKAGRGFYVYSNQ